jgi:hypothetical protein
MHWCIVTIETPIAVALGTASGMPKPKNPRFPGALIEMTIWE